MSEKTPGPITEAIPDISKLRETFDDLNGQVEDLTEQVATLTEANDALEQQLGAQDAEVIAARHAATEAETRAAEASTREQEAIARASQLAELVDAAAAGQAVARPREAGYAAGDLVSYVFRDVVTGDQLTGPGVVVRSGEGAQLVAPLSPAQLQLPTEAVAHLTVAAMLGEAEPEDEDA